MQASPLLVCRVREQQASSLMMAGEAISGREAERIGLVARCVPAGTVFGEALKVARKIVTVAPETVRENVVFNCPVLVQLTAAKSLGFGSGFPSAA
jgi:enoyl-CoA hydratase/carnithine racemase